MTEHEKARLAAAIARGKLAEVRNVPKVLVTTATYRGEEHDGYSPSRIILQKKPPPRR
jgi:hypothetical protein